MFPILIFCDGASSGNPGPSGWGVVIVRPQGEIEELGGRVPSATNNQMELMGSLEGLRGVRDEPGPVGVYTDSTYVIRGITQWIWGWRKKGWKTAEGKDVSNVELWKAISAELAHRGKENPVEWHYVRGHAGIPGNERVDAIAVEFSKGRRPNLYRGPLLQYEIPIHDLPENTELPAPKPISAEKKAPAFSYLSDLGGAVHRHSSWADCERRVKGRSGAKFKKSKDASDEAKILAEWKVDPKKVVSE